METRSRAHRIARIVTFVVPAFLIVFALLVWAVSALWNGLMPAIFGLPTITYWQALGLMALSWILFGGLRGEWPGLLIALVGLLGLATGASGYCPLYVPFGISTAKTKMPA